MITKLLDFPCRRYCPLWSVHSAVFGSNGRHYFFKSLVGSIIPFKLSNKKQIEYKEKCQCPARPIYWYNINFTQFPIINFQSQRTTILCGVVRSFSRGLSNTKDTIIDMLFFNATFVVLKQDHRLSLLQHKEHSNALEQGALSEYPQSSKVRTTTT